MLENCAGVSHRRGIIMNYKIAVPFERHKGEEKMKKIYALTAALMLSVAAASVAGASAVYLGPEGTFSEQAAYDWFDGSGEELRMLKTVQDCVKAVDEGTSDFAVIPLENTIGGLAGNKGLYIDAFLAAKDLRVVGQVDVGIRQMLMGVKGTTVEGIKTVWSHPQGLAQGKAWLAQNLPDVTTEQTASTAEAARMAAEKKDVSVAAIAAPRAAEVYGLEIVVPDIQISRANVTRFWVIAKPENAARFKLNRGITRTSLAVSGPAAGLTDLLGDLQSLGLTLAAIHERPMKTALGDYLWVLEFMDNGGNEDKIAEAAKAHEAMKVRYLGTYNCK